MHAPRCFAGVLTFALTLGVCAMSLPAQVAIPATPKKFKVRAAGSSTASVGNVTPPATRSTSTLGKTKYTSYLSISPPRQWQSTDGKSLLGSLIAFEDVVTYLTAGETAPPLTAPPTLTVVKDGKARLLIDNKPYELPLERLSQADRDLIEKTRAAFAARDKALQK